MPDREAAAKAEALLKEMMAARDSIGGTIDCEITGLPVGLGETVFEKLDANLAKAMMSIGAVKGVRSVTVSARRLPMVLKIMTLSIWKTAAWQKRQITPAVPSAA